nr:PREDICTED: C-X-C motif chemokine 10-like isoform X2 [Latimeria chalumnae]|eukprot:XP_005995967.2 PREDICTED: C-X-C motif chemokine 10-like isoform X2 [Latimeria chalumnae]
MMDSKVILIALLGVAIALAQDVSTGGARCSCPQLSDRIMAPKEIKTIEILPPTSSCKNLEVIVHLKKGRKYCLNPNAKKMKEIFRQLKTRVLA